MLCQQWPNVWKAEFNAIADPHSAKAVLSSAIPNIILVPLDATEEVPMSPEYMATLATLESHEGRFTSELTHRVRNDWWCESFNVMPYPPTACYTGLMTHGQALPS